MPRPRRIFGRRLPNYWAEKTALVQWAWVARPRPESYTRPSPCSRSCVMAVLTEEQTMLRDSARTWTAENVPVTALRKVRDNGSGFDPKLWSEMGQMGWTGVIIPEAFGG